VAAVSTRSAPQQRILERRRKPVGRPDSNCRHFDPRRWLPAAHRERTLHPAGERTLGVEVVPLEIRRVEDFSPAFEAIKAKADALYVAIDQLMVANLMRILTLALGARLPTIFSTRDFVRGGGFMSYGPSYMERFGRAADCVDKLRGAKPGDIPVEQPTKFELVVNLITAQALGLTMPPSLLSIADEVIE
jgi:putative ABC transport system substrate-binding protein